jgi:hypothetical protein
MKGCSTPAMLLVMSVILLSGLLFVFQMQTSASASTAVLVYMPDIPNHLTTGLGTVAGVVYDASTRIPLGTAQVCYGPSCDITDSSGAYSISGVPSGWRVLTASATDHYALTEGLYVLGQTTNQQDFSLSTVSSSGDVYMRIVVNWDSTTSWPPSNVPNDLDASLWFDGSVFTRITSWYIGDCTTFPNACLELDVQEGYGPETIAVRQLENGAYHFGVLNVNAAYAGVPLITQLDVVVRVYDDSGLLKEFQVPGVGEGDFWYVFSMSSDGTIQAQNCITGEPGDNEVPVCPP